MRGHVKVDVSGDHKAGRQRVSGSAAGTVIPNNDLSLTDVAKRKRAAGHVVKAVKESVELAGDLEANVVSAVKPVRVLGMTRWVVGVKSGINRRQSMSGGVVGQAV